MNVEIESIAIIISIIGTFISIGTLLVWFGSFKQKVSQNTKDIDTIKTELKQL